MNYKKLLLAGNALAVHDIETAIYGTSLDIPIDEERAEEKGHGFHLKAINKVRKAGSIRDDGPLPDVVTDTVTKLADRGSAQAVGLVTDVELFLSSLVNQL